MTLKLHHLPIIMIVALQGTIAITFYLSCFYYENHVTYMLPYISDTGTFQPESCIFGQILNISALLIAVIVYLKYRQVEVLANKHNLNKKDNINKTAFVLGCLSALGIDIVGNFQETSWFTVHWIGAILTFGCGALYLCVQTHLYFAIVPIIGQRKLTRLRLVLSIISTVSFIIFITTAFLAYSKFRGEDYTKWTAEDGGYMLHQVSTHSEWICALSILTYILLISKELKNVSIERPKVIVQESRQVKDTNLLNM